MRRGCLRTIQQYVIIRRVRRDCLRTIHQHVIIRRVRRGYLRSIHHHMVRTLHPRKLRVTLEA